MLFKKQLDALAVPEWRTVYLNYKGGKKLCKAIAAERMGIEGGTIATLAQETNDGVGYDPSRLDSSVILVTELADVAQHDAGTDGVGSQGTHPPPMLSRREMHEDEDDVEEEGEEGEGGSDAKRDADGDNEDEEDEVAEDEALMAARDDIESDEPVRDREVSARRLMQDADEAFSVLSIIAQDDDKQTEAMHHAFVVERISVDVADMAENAVRLAPHAIDWAVPLGIESDEFVHAGVLPSAKLGVPMDAFRSRLERTAPRFVGREVIGIGPVRLAPFHPPSRLVRYPGFSRKWRRLEMQFCIMLWENRWLINVFFTRLMRKLNCYVSELEEQASLFLAEKAAVGTLNRDLRRKKRLLDRLFRSRYSFAAKVESYRITNVVGFYKVTKKHDKVSKLNVAEYLRERMSGDPIYVAEGVIGKLAGRIAKAYQAFCDRDIREVASVTRVKRGAFYGQFINTIDKYKKHMWGGIMLALGVMVTIVTSVLLFVLSQNDVISYTTAGDSQLRTTHGIESGVEAVVVYRTVVGFCLMMLWWAVDVIIFRRWRVNVAFIVDADDVSSPASNFRVFGGVLFIVGIFMGLFAAAGFTTDGNIGGIASDTYFVIGGLVGLAVPLVAPSYVYWRALVLRQPLTIPKVVKRRKRWLRKIFRIFIKPYANQVKFSDFFLADQLTSLSALLPTFLFSGCALVVERFGTGALLDDVGLTTGSEALMRNIPPPSADAADDLPVCTRVFLGSVLTFIMMAWPFGIRFVQCVRRYVDSLAHARNLWREGRAANVETIHLWNCGKYFMGMMAVVVSYIRFLYAIRAEDSILGGIVGSDAVAVGSLAANNLASDSPWPVLSVNGREEFEWVVAMFIVVRVVAAMYALIWDLTIDWGLLENPRKGIWLRKTTLYPQWRYVFAMVLNTVLRFVWLMDFFGLFSNDGTISPYFVASFTAFLEVCRRGNWNIYRIENEQVNNVGKFRVVKSVPLPYHTE